MSRADAYPQLPWANYTFTADPRDGTGLGHFTFLGQAPAGTDTVDIVMNIGTVNVEVTSPDGYFVVLADYPSNHHRRQANPRRRSMPRRGGRTRTCRRIRSRRHAARHRWSGRLTARAEHGLVMRAELANMAAPFGRTHLTGSSARRRSRPIRTSTPWPIAPREIPAIAITSPGCIGSRWPSD